MAQKLYVARVDRTHVDALSEVATLIDDRNPTYPIPSQTSVDETLQQHVDIEFSVGLHSSIVGAVNGKPHVSINALCS